MRLIFGGLLLIASFFDTLFFRNYKGEVISHPTLWYWLFFIAGITGALLIISSFRRMKELITDTNDVEIEKLKARSEKIELDFDSCEFKNGSFSHEVSDGNVNSVSFIAPGSLGLLADARVTENVTQSYLVCTCTVDGKPTKYISHSFPFDPTTLGFYVLNHNISLYVDRFDQNKYFFDLKR